MNILVLIPFTVVGIFILLALIWFMGYEKGRKDAHEFAVQMLCTSVTPQRPKGKWIKVDPLGTGDEAYMCSACKTGDWSVTVGEYKFCPYCGAEMSGGGEE